MQWDVHRIRFSEHYALDHTSIHSVKAAIGVYFIFLSDLRIPYPMKSSRLIYIGMSYSKQNGVGKRLWAHRRGHAGNRGISRYAANHALRFTYHGIDLLQATGARNVQELERFFLSQFEDLHGAHPICNRQSEDFTPTRFVVVDWTMFD